MAIQGFPRATMDIDLLIREESLNDAFKIAAENGFDIRGLDISFTDPPLEIRRVSKIIDNAILCLAIIGDRRDRRRIRNAGKGQLFRQVNFDGFTRRIDQTKTTCRPAAGFGQYLSNRK